MKIIKRSLLVPIILLACICLVSAFTADTDGPTISGKIQHPVFDKRLNAYTISFAGYKWTVRDTKGTQGPGPNYWSKENVFVDGKGYLHIKLTKDSANTWHCAEVVTTHKMGYGTYQWTLDGRVDTLDHQLVFGLFNYSGNDLHDEMDIEFSRWGHPENDRNLNYTIWPAANVDTPRNVEYLQNFVLRDNYSTHRFIRTANSLKLQSLYGFQDGNKDLFAEKTWTAPPTSISTLEMPVHINLWCFKGVPPTNGREVEIIVRDFKYKP
jgi:hypothetical protein